MLTHIHKTTERVKRETNILGRRALDEVRNNHRSRLRHGRAFYAHLARSTAVRAAPRRRILRHKDAATPSLKDRLGSLPLAERLALAGPRTSAQKRRRTKQRRVQKKAGGMDVD